MEHSTQLNTDNEELLVYTSEQLMIHVLGGIKIAGLDRLRVTLKVQSTMSKVQGTPEIQHHPQHPVYSTYFPLRYNLDLYNSDQCEKFIRRTAEHFELELKEIRQLLMGLIEALEGYRIKKIEEGNTPRIKPKELTKEEEQAAMDYLKGKHLLKRLQEDIGRSGVIGEESNRLLMFIVFTSRKLNNPLHIITLGQSGQGKTHLQEKVAELIPEEDKIEMTTMTKNSLYYFGQYELHQKLILIEDLDGTTEESLYAIRELQSKKRLSKTLAVKDSKGNLKTQTVIVEGRVTIAGTTTKEAVYEDNSNRSILIHVDSSKEQDQRIMYYQRRKSSGGINLQEEQPIKELLKNVQRVLKPVIISNPFAAYLKLPDTVKTPRRTMTIYLGFIEAITYLHQYQRKLKNNELETTIEDIQWANKLLHEVLLRKSDDLSQAGRNTLEQIKDYLMLKDKATFYSKEIRTALKINVNTLKRHLRELERNDFIKITQGSRYLGYEYRVLSAAEYEQLKQQINQVLNQLVEQLPNKAR